MSYDLSAYLVSPCPRADSSTRLDPRLLRFWRSPPRTPMGSSEGFVRVDGATRSQS